jgi:phytoene dehydrogenase-like protein
MPDVIVVGAGPNGLAAAITVARAGLSVVVVEAGATIGGGTRTEELTLPGYRHDVCSTILPLTLASPFFRSIDLATLGIDIIQPDAPVGHAMDGGRAGVIERSVDATAAALGRDGRAWQRLFGPLAANADKLGSELLRPVLHVPRHPIAMARFGLLALLSATGLARVAFRGEEASAVFAGLAAHSMIDLHRPLSASFGLVLGLYAHAAGWPMVRGGSAAVADGLAAELRSLGGTIETSRRIASLGELPPARAIILDTTPRAAVAIAGDRLPGRTRRIYERFRYGSGVFKIDWALDGPIPWRAADLRRVATVHLGGTIGEVAAAERTVARGGHPDRPFVLCVQYSPWDDSRAPAGKTTAWAYCHVPSGSTVDMTARIEGQVERFAPGFRDRILARATRGPAELEADNPNYVGGDINAGIEDIRQLIFRPGLLGDPYWTGAPGLYLCSSSTPPGGGVHGMSGYLAARSALRREFGRRI